MEDWFELGTFKNPNVGEFLLENLGAAFPNVTVEVLDIERDGHPVKGLRVKTNFLMADEMKAYARGFFTAYNNRHKLA